MGAESLLIRELGGPRPRVKKSAKLKIVTRPLLSTTYIYHCRIYYRSITVYHRQVIENMQFSSVTFYR